jgi:hypothetical protein
VLAVHRDHQGIPSPQISKCWDNFNSVNQVGIFPAGDEIFDWGVKECLGTSFVTRLAIGYSTTVLDPSLGGPGATFRIALYKGTTGFGLLGVELAAFDLQGLPGTQVPGQIAT